MNEVSRLETAEPAAEAWARNKARSSNSATIDLLGIAEELGASVIKRDYGREGKPQGSLERTISGGWRVVIPAQWLRKSNLRTRARFSIAHELAHILLQERGVPVPTDRRDYWRLESACNRIGGALLVPSWIIPARPMKPGAALAVIHYIRNMCNVSFDVAATEAVNAANNIAGAATICIDDDEGPRISFSSGVFPARGTRIRAGRLANLVERAADSTICHARANLSLDGEDAEVCMRLRATRSKTTYVHAVAVSPLTIRDDQIRFEHVDTDQGDAVRSTPSSLSSGTAPYQLDLFNPAVLSLSSQQTG